MFTVRALGVRTCVPSVWSRVYPCVGRFYKNVFARARHRFAKVSLFRRGIVLQTFACLGAVPVRNLVCSGAASFYKSLLVRARHRLLVCSGAASFYKSLLVQARHRFTKACLFELTIAVPVYDLCC